MTKRRRERDKPKAGPNALYNPSKRVLLSYAPDDELEEQPVSLAGPEGPGATAVDTSNYTIAPYPDEQEDPSVQPGSDTAVTDEAEEEPREEDVADEDAVPVPTKGLQRHPLTGQHLALGALSYQWDEDEDGETGDYDSEEEEAMAYLRAVRSERQAMPTVFGAGHDNFDKTLYDTVVDDSRGYVSGGAYIGRAMPAAADQLHEIELKDPQTYYAKGLKRRFLEQRRQMHLAPGLAALEELNDKHPISLPSGSNKAYAEWGRLLKTTAPLAVQVRSMEQATVRRLLELTDRLYLLRGKDIDTVTSTWIWSLLARLDDVGTMDNDEVCAIRDLGKKAVLVQLSFRDSAAAKQLDDLGARSSPEAFNPAEVSLEDEEDDATNGTPTTPSNTAIGIPAKRQNTLATLDMIITVVGDVFGQRDLLEFRQKWEATVGASKSTLS